jgi:hypothetical protein
MHIRSHSVILRSNNIQGRLPTSITPATCRIQRDLTTSSWCIADTARCYQLTLAIPVWRLSSLASFGVSSFVSYSAAMNARLSSSTLLHDSSVVDARRRSLHRDRVQER